MSNFKNTRDMVKSYLRHEFLASFGAVASSHGNVCALGAHHAVAAAGELGIIWHVRKSELVGVVYR